MSSGDWGESQMCSCSLCGYSYDLGNEAVEVRQFVTKNSVISPSKNKYAICHFCFSENQKALLPMADIHPEDKRFDVFKTVIESNCIIENTIYEYVDDYLADLSGEDQMGKIINFEDYQKKTNETPIRESRNPMIFGEPVELKAKPMNNTIKKAMGPNKSALDSFLTPKEIFNELRKSVKGQDKALMDLSVATFMYLASLRNKDSNKVNIMIVGGTGTGKTQMVSSLAKILAIPFTEFNSSHLTPSGYKGDNVVSIAEKIIALHGLKEGSTSILYLDEVDKLAGPGDHNELNKKVQQELLKILEGGNILTSDAGSRRETINFPTRNVFVIASGAFPEIERSKKRKLNHKSVGLNSTKKEAVEFCFTQTNTEDLIDYGLIPEFVGRFSMITNTKKIDIQTGLDILKSSSNTPLKDYELLFLTCKSEIIFDESFLKNIIVIPGLSEDTGARGFKKKLDEFMAEHVFNIDQFMGKKVTVYDDGIHVEEFDMVA